MPVCSYYCASCGQKLSPDEARYGRPKMKVLDWYCRTCASELEIEPIEAPGGVLDEIPDARPRRTPGRGSGRTSGRMAPVRLAPEPARSPSAFLAAVAGGVMVLGASLVFFAWRTDVGPVGPSPSLAPAAVASRAPQADGQAAMGAVAQPAPAAEVAPASAMPPSPPPPPTPAPPPHVTPPAPPPAAPLAETLVGNKNTKKVHRPACKWAQKVTEKNRTTFASLDEARKAGFEPCKECLAH